MNYNKIIDNSVVCNKMDWELFLIMSLLVLLITAPIMMMIIPYPQGPYYIEESVSNGVVKDIRTVENTDGDYFVRLYFDFTGTKAALSYIEHRHDGGHSHRLSARQQYYDFGPYGVYWYHPETDTNSGVVVGQDGNVLGQFSVTISRVNPVKG